MTYSEMKDKMRKVIRRNGQTILLTDSEYKVFKRRWELFVNSRTTFAISVKAKCMDVYLKYMPTVPCSQQMKLAKLNGWLTL